MNQPVSWLEEDIIIHFNKGCQKAFEKLYEQFNPHLILFARNIINDEFVAEDIVMELFTKLWDKRASFPAIKNVKAFLFISTKNACFNYLTHIRYKSRVIRQIQFIAKKEEDYVLNKIVMEETLEELYNEIENLPQQCKIVVVKHLAGKHNKKVAQELRITHHTVRNQLTRGRDLMCRRVQQREGLTQERIHIYSQ